MVGPKVGNELRQKAFWAVLGSLGGILLYVGFRYEFKFAFGAVVSLFHDVFVILGLLCFTGREVSLTVIAALLTIAGYSINDTIVVFDRIRERSKALRKEKHSRAVGHRGQRDPVAHRDHRAHRFLAALACSSGAARSSTTSRSRCWSARLRHLLLGLRRQRAGARHLDRSIAARASRQRSERSAMKDLRSPLNRIASPPPSCWGCWRWPAAPRRSPASTPASRPPKAGTARTRG